MPMTGGRRKRAGGRHAAWEDERHAQAILKMVIVTLLTSVFMLNLAESGVRELVHPATMRGFLSVLQYGGHGDGVEYEVRFLGRAFRFDPTVRLLEATRDGETLTLVIFGRRFELGSGGTRPASDRYNGDEKPTAEEGGTGVLDHSRGRGSGDRQ